eukprot:4180809-Amphidinium_carterae.1
MEELQPQRSLLRARLAFLPQETLCGDTTLETSGESVVEPPSAKRTRRIELVHVPKRGFGPPIGNAPEDRVRLLEGRLITNALKIERRGSIIAKNQAVERLLEERRRSRRDRTDPDVAEVLPKPSPPPPPPPKQPPDTLARDMEEAMACAKARNADTGWAENLVGAMARAKDAINAGTPVERDQGPVPVIQPPPTTTPKHWEAKTVAAAKRAAEVIAKAKEVLYPSKSPNFKPPPKELASSGNTVPPCPVLKAISERNGEGPLPPPPEMKSLQLGGAVPVFK